MENMIKTEKFIQELGETLDLFLLKSRGKRMGFGLLIFELDNPGGTSYVTNADREGVILSLENVLKKLKRKKDFPFPVGSA